MKMRFELRDMEHPNWRGHRFADVDRARREWRAAADKRRFRVIDRVTGSDVTIAPYVLPPGDAVAQWALDELDR